MPSNFLSSKINGQSVTHHGLIATDERFKIMNEHHAYVIPASFDSKIQEEYCYSIPTKLPELLVSGRPTLIYGPPTMEAHRFCKDNDCGYLIDVRSVEKLMEALIEIMENYQESLSASIDQAKKIQSLISKSTQVPRFHDFLLS